MTPEFRHDEPGTSAQDWDEARRVTPALDLTAEAGRLVVAAAHPDDETLGVGGLMAQLSAAGWQVQVVCASDGEGSHPSSPTHTAARLAARRRTELEQAVRLVSPAASITHLALPDGSLAEHPEEVTAALVEQIGTDGDRTLLCAPWRSDKHPDHEAVGRAAALAAHRTDARLVEYPIWFWHWGSVDSPPPGLRAVALTEQGRAAKERAIDAHASQVRPLSSEPGDEVLLSPAFLEHFRAASEWVIEDPRADDTALDDLHRSDPDPWDVGSWYERRKRVATLAALPCERYRRVLEVGCSVGELAADLAERADRVVAVDSSREAVRLATSRLGACEHVEVQLMDVPDEWPVEDFDLVCVSELGYFLSPARLSRLIDRTLSSLAPGGQVLLCHWKPQPVGWPLDGAAVHQRFAEAVVAAGGRALVGHDEEKFLLHVYELPQ